MSHIGRDWARFRYWELATSLLRESSEAMWPRVREAVGEHGVDLSRTAVVYVNDGKGENVHVLDQERNVLSVSRSVSSWDYSRPDVTHYASESYARYGPTNKMDHDHASEWVSRPVKYVQYLTEWMRTSELRRWSTLREAIIANGADPQKGAVAELGLDQHSLDGVFVSEDRRLFEYDMWLPVEDPQFKSNREVAENAYVEKLDPGGAWAEQEAPRAFWFLDIEAGVAPSWPLEWFVGSRDEAFHDW